MKKNERQLIKTNESAENDEYRKLIILIIIIASVFIVFYVLTTLFTKKDKDSIFKNDLNPSEIQYQEIIIGSMFDKDGEYYVLLIEDNDQYKELYDSYITSINKNKIYTVDLANAFNKQYVSDEYSYDEDNFKVKGTVLLKINNHNIKAHFTDKSEIITELKKLVD